MGPMARYTFPAVEKIMIFMLPLSINPKFQPRQGRMDLLNPMEKFLSKRVVSRI
jgi:hypothetical protein